MNETDKPAEDVSATLKKLLDERGEAKAFPARLCTSYPYIAENICKYWRDPTTLHEYFNDLLTTNREKRTGFPPEVHFEIFSLSNYYLALHPKPEKIDDFWRGLDTR